MTVKYFARTSGLIAVAAVLSTVGCAPADYAPSGLVEELGADDLIKSAAASHQIRIVDEFGGTGGKREQCYELSRDLTVRMASGATGDLLREYRQHVEKHILAKGACITHNGTVTPGDGRLRDFSYRYRLGRNEGFVRVWSMPSSATELRMILYSYEHRH